MKKVKSDNFMNKVLIFIEISEADIFVTIINIL